MKETWKIFGTYLLVLFFILVCNNAFSQTKFCKQEICVVEFNADWNKENSVEWLDDLEDCGIIRISIDENKITKLEIPTGNPLILKFDENKKLISEKYLDKERAKDLLVFN